MSGPSPLAAPADPPAPARVLIEEQLAMLARLAEIGMGIAEDAGRRSAAGPDEAGAGDRRDPALDFARAARAVRLTIALQSRLMADLAALDQADQKDRITQAGVRRARIHRQIERAAWAEYDGDEYRDEAEIRRLSSDAREWLRDADPADILGRSVGEIVARICRDLGLDPADSARICAECAEAEAFAAAPWDAPPDPPGPDWAAAAAPPCAPPAARSRAPPEPVA